MADALGSSIAATVAGFTLPEAWVSGPTAICLPGYGATDGTIPNPSHDVGLTGNGAFASHFFWDFYNRVYVSPAHVDFGALANQATQYADVWSAWLVSINLTQVTETATEGLELYGISPKIFAPLELEQYAVTALLDGPPSIDARYQFEFDSGDTPMVTVSGSRAKVWPFAVDWKLGFRVNLSYKTDIFVTRSRKEQRRALRTTPRKTVEFSSITSGTKLRTFRALMASWQNKSMIMPDVTRKVLLSAASTDGATSIVVDGTPDWLAAGATVVLSEGERREIRKIDHLESSTVIFTASSGAWSAGTKVHPGLQGVLSGELTANQLTDSTARVGVRFEVDPASEPLRAAGSAVASLEGREVFTRKPNWRDGVDVSYQYESETVDYGRGVIARFRPVGFGTQIFKASYVGRDSANLLAIQQVFERAKGRRGEFHISTGMPDLVLKAQALVGNFYIRVAGQEVFSAFATDTVHRAIEVVMNDGTRFYRKLVGEGPITAVTDGDGSDTLIQITDDLPWTIEPETVSRISWLPAARFASDEMTIEYLTDEVGQTQLAIQTLEDLAVE